MHPAGQRRGLDLGRLAQGDEKGALVGILGVGRAERVTPRGAPQRGVVSGDELGRRPVAALGLTCRRFEWHTDFKPAIPPRAPQPAVYPHAAMATCVVTGGAGFLGSHLCDHLLDKGYRVICIDNLDTGSLENIDHIGKDADFEFINQDMTEHVSIDEDVDFIYHLASPASPIDYARLPLHTLKVGSYGTHHMLGVAKFKRARFLIASTSEVYGDPQVHPQSEDYWGHVNPIGPRGVYDEAKRYAEALTMAYHRQQGVDTCIARIFNTYGPRMRPHDGRAIPTFLRQALQDKPLTVFGDGSQTRSFCFVDDLIRG